MALFLDIGCVCERDTDAALDVIYKAMSGQNGDDDMWTAHPNPFVRRLVELFTQRGIDQLDKVRTELTAWMAGERARVGTTPSPRPEGMMGRWDHSELALVKIYLESLPTEAYMLADYMMVCDYLVQRYLPADALRSEAQWMATRASMMGRVQANMARAASGAAIDRVLAGLPNSIEEAVGRFPMTPLQVKVMEFANNRAAEYVTRIGEETRHTMRRIIAQDIEDRAFGTPTGGRSLEGKLLDAFGSLNKDWRRIAVTEAGEAEGQSFIAFQAPGARVKRIEQYRNACAFCAKINGTVLNVVDPSDPDKDGTTDVWVGKTNIGRSSSPRKRVGDHLLEREPDEMWWIPAGVCHPHCRGSWVAEVGMRPGDDPEFHAWMVEQLKPTIPSNQHSIDHPGE